MRSERFVPVMVALLIAAACCAGCGSSRAPASSLTPGASPPPLSAGTAQPGRTVDDLLSAGQAALGAGSLSDAEAAYREAVRTNPKFAPAQFGLGNVYVRQGRLAEAEAAYRAAIAADPTMAAAHMNLGVVYYQLGSLSKAAEAYDAALRLQPDDAQTLYLLAAVRIQGSQLSEAEELLNRAKAAQPDLAEVYYGLGALYKLQGKTEEAISAFETFLSLGTAQDPAAMDAARAELRELKGE